MVASFPDIHKKVMHYVINFLQTHILPPEVQEKTKMGVDNIALIFGASLLQNPDQKNEDLLTNSELANRFVRTLLGRTLVSLAFLFCPLFISFFGLFLS